MAKKIAGKERPYDYREFFYLVLELAKQQGHDFEIEANLDYFNAYYKYDIELHKDIYGVLEDIEWYLLSETHFGYNEGIYTHFYIRRYSYQEQKFVRFDFATAKTLGTRDEDYLAMHTMAARFELLAKDYVDKHQEEFNWKGYDVTGYKDGRTYGGWYCPRKENSEKRAEELLQAGADYVTIRDNRSREIRTIGK